MKYLKQLFTFVFVLLLMGCFHTDDDSKQLTLDRNMSIWNKANISDYQYTFRRSCFCFSEEDVVIIVKAKVITEAFYSPSGVYLGENELDRLHTIPKLFGIVQEAIDSNAASLNVTYNSEFGYPEKIDIDRIKEAVDDEVVYYAIEFQ